MSILPLPQCRTRNRSWISAVSWRSILPPLPALDVATLPGRWQATRRVARPEPHPKLWPAEQQQENAAFLQLMVTLNTSHDSPADMAQRIQAELDKGADINAKDSEGFPMIVTAASLAHTDVVQVLLEHGADQNAVTAQVDKSSATDSTSILHKTANGYQVNIGDAITSLFAKKPKPLFGQTALMFAAQTGQADMVTLLLTPWSRSPCQGQPGQDSARLCRPERTPGDHGTAKGTLISSLECR